MKIRSVVFSLIAISLMILPGISGQAGQTPRSVQFAPASVIPVDPYPTGIASGDFNNDGIMDLAVVAPNAGNLLVALGQGNGTFGPWLYSLTTYSPFIVAAGNFGGPNLDAVVSDGAGSDGLLMLGTGDGSFPSSTPIYVNRGVVQGIAIGDFNGDHNEDLAVTNGSGTVYVYLGNGNGTFRGRRTYQAGGNGGTFIIAADFTGDGVTDLMLFNSIGSNGKPNIAVLPGIGNGTFGAPMVFPLPRSFVAAGFAAADFNSDHMLDLAIIGFEQNGNRKQYAYILLGNGNGTFRAGARFDAGNSISSIATADFNGDGNVDLAVGNTDPQNYVGSVSILLGNGDGTFQPHIVFPTNGQLTGNMTVADFNGDGKPDIAILGTSSATVSILLNTTPFPVNRISVSQR